MMSPRPRHQTPGRSRFASTTPTPNATPTQKAGQGSKVRVVVRVRPFLASEIEAQGDLQACTTVVKGADDSEATLCIAEPKTCRNESYKLDMCYEDQTDSFEIFEKELQPMLPILFRGHNVTLFTYGATGSGKTYTIQGTAARPGLMPLAMTKILASAQNLECSVKLSCYEVYMDRCYDLLRPKTEVSVLEDCNGRIQLRGLSQVEVRTVAEFQVAFADGCARRKVGQTGLNDASSRSHAVSMVTVTCGSNEAHTVGKLNLIDLAGNEDNRKSGNEGVRLLESGKINASLFALSNVINALNANEVHVPYRDTKLTRILQDSLGGTSRATMVACLNPGSFQEASQTLSLAARSRQIVNHTLPPEGESELMEVGGTPSMEAKLSAWRETKGKTPVKSTPSRKKTSCQSPNALRSMRTPSTNRKRSLLCPRLAQQDFGVDFNVDKTDDSVVAISGPVSGTASLEQVEEVVVLRDDPDSKVTELPANVPVNEQEAEKENSPQESPAWATHCKLPKMQSSPPLSARLRDIRNALMELSPMSSNVMKTGKTVSSFPMDAPLLSSCSEPDSAFSPTIKENPLFSATPMEDFDTTSRDYESTLLAKYLRVFNTASRDELLKLKGIGERRADLLLALRVDQTEPIQELADLGKIGLSAKQARKLFIANVARKLESNVLF